MNHSSTPSTPSPNKKAKTTSSHQQVTPHKLHPSHIEHQSRDHHKFHDTNKHTSSISNERLNNTDDSNTSENPAFDLLAIDQDTEYFDDPRYKIDVKELTQSYEYYLDSQLNYEGHFILAEIVNVKKSKKTDDRFSYYLKQKDKAERFGVYDRIIRFREHDSLNGQTGEIIFTQKPIRQLVLLDHMNDSAVGCMVIIVEPKWTGRIGQDRVPIFEVTQDHGIIPIEHNVPRIKRNIPIVPLEESSMRCFGYHSVQIQLIAINFIQSCSGVLCDHTEDTGECFCFTKGRLPGINFECDLFFSADSNPAKKLSEWFHIRQYRSYRLFKMFMDSNLDYNDACRNKKAIRSHIKKEVEFINNHGGWYITGWYKQGLKEVDTDVKGQNIGTSAGKSDSIAKMGSIDITPHISTLTPTQTQNLARITKWSLTI